MHNEELLHLIAEQNELLVKFRADLKISERVAANSVIFNEIKELLTRIAEQGSGMTPAETDAVTGKLNQIGDRIEGITSGTEQS